MTADLIALDGVHKYYGSVHALRGIDLRIAAGEVLSLLGPSGCGKTTLLRTIAGFERPDSGRLTIDGQDMARVPPNRRPTNMLFQSYAIFPHLGVAENVGFGLRRSGLSAADKARQIGAALEMVGLASHGARAAHALSGGQRQRVALACALVLKPKVLLLDEPLWALDRMLREQMQAGLRRLQRQVGITFVLATHDRQEALTMSDRIAVMLDGEIAQIDPPEALYRRPRSRRVGEFIGMMNLLDGALVADGNRLIGDVAGLGRMPLAAENVPEGARPGPATFGLRPDALSILFDSEALPTGYFADGRIADRSYCGDMTHYGVALPVGDARVICSSRTLLSRPVLDPGAAVRLAFDPGAVVVFPQGEPE